MKNNLIKIKYLNYKILANFKIIIFKFKIYLLYYIIINNNKNKFNIDL